VAAGSVNAICRVPMSCGTSITLADGIVISSANPPGRDMPIIVRSAHKLSRPVMQ
jgi:hypothetical protein